MTTPSSEHPALLDLTARVAEPAVAAVWSLSSFDPANLEHRRKVLTFYPPGGTRSMYGFAVDGQIVTTCGVTRYDNGRITIHQVATVPDHRRRGLARRLLSSIVEHLDPKIVQCGTDAPSVEFYRACGFECTSEGIPPSGIERFGCTLRR